MVVYYCSWEKDKDLSKGSGRGRPTTKSYGYTLTVLCRNIKDALFCFHWVFEREFEHNTGVSINDGVLSLKRVALDSRNFHIQYLYMDDIKQPICLYALKDSLASYPACHVRY